MPDSGQLMTFDHIREELALLRGYRLTSADWTDEQTSIIEKIMVKGLNKFYHGASYDWSFLKPLAELTIANGSQELVLPKEFAYLVGDIYFDSTAGGYPLVVENEAKVLRRRQQAPDQTGRPLFACITPTKPGLTKGTRQVLSFWPTADDEYDFALRYSILPESLSASNPYPYGGQAYSNAILEACLAASEQMDGDLGIHTQLYEQALAGAISYDRKVKAQTLGRENQLRRPARYSNVVTLSDDFYLD